MIQLDNFVDGVSVHLGTQTAGSVPRTAVIFAARQAVKQFCDDSLAYIVRASDDPQKNNAITDTSRVFMMRQGTNCQLALPRNTFIKKVWQLSDGCCGRKALNKATHNYPNVIELFNEKDKADDVVVSLSINQHALECPDFIYHEYYDGILSGTICYLQAMPNREWAAPNFSQYHQQQFEQAIKDARKAVDDGFRKARSNSTIPAKFQ